MRQGLRSVSMNSTAIDRRFVLLGTLSFVGLAALNMHVDAATPAADPAFAAAAKMAEGGYAIVLMARDGTLLRTIPLSARGHDIALHKATGRAVAFARRPGTFAAAFDLSSVRAPVIFNAIEGRHFYGHGAFSADGRLLFVSENDIAAGQGVIGLYDVQAGYRRVGEMPSYGVGPHEIILLADGKTLAVANGGIDTVPEAGRAMLNLDDMKPNLAFVNAEGGTLIARHELGAGLNRLSIRHIAAGADGAVWFGGQWEDDLAASPELVGRASRDAAIALITPRQALGPDLKGYIGSVAASADGRIIAASAPKAGRIVYVSTESGAVIAESGLPDGCGVAGEYEGGFAVSSGFGVFRHEDPASASAAQSALPAPKLIDERTLAGMAFDNHLRRI